MAPQKSAKRKVAPLPMNARSGQAKSDTQANPLFERRPRHFGIGQSIQPKRDLTRFVKWPKYVRLQRQRKILRMRLKVPPAVNQFSQTLDRNTAVQLFKLLAKYRPETDQEKKTRLNAQAEKVAAGQQADTAKQLVVKHGINHITNLVESKKAKLVVIANDVDPIELVIWLPALCRKMGVPYCIVKSKSRLGTVVHRKTATALALVDIKDEDKQPLASLVEAINANFADKSEESRRTWGGGIMGIKAQAKIAKRDAATAREVKLA
ncbi:60S ribosomal protein L8 [Coemansia sp. RSA 2706]|nr:60S ribosomal protein L8 [Coemansia sp. RSA 2711]KAJ1836862.1 60S ribosomal protein L8 [Coemansia sp. RSA 2708]KAJ2303756.1 60S ribosomal protein L8 [Coemansia sp. RSA 2706]KAJ2308287.1 60S ribosomal protein L8 [Coemansia sp. RSA 2705]KAJ2318596.1 60S ribosomal protein L8 [Coemansia sp. RSA 2704]KAJ2738194.1 60S ribosomal protein L8 [Coemansia sp. Cherry 401B]